MSRGFFSPQCGAAAHVAKDSEVALNVRRDSERARTVRTDGERPSLAELLSRARVSCGPALAKFIPIALLLFGCDELDPNVRRMQLEDMERERPCQDESTLVATTAGSPNGFRCSNREHRMRVEVKTQSGEEIAALVICECEREEPGE